jgi:hypothetical protein
MFHMTNDSDKFRTAEELERLGAYRVTGQRWEKGDQRWLPLYEGKWCRFIIIATLPCAVTQITSANRASQSIPPCIPIRLEQVAQPLREAAGHGQRRLAWCRS